MGSPRFLVHPDGRWAVRYLDGSDWHVYDARGALLGPHDASEAGWVPAELVPAPPVAVDPDKPCPHEQFTAVVTVTPLTKVEGGPIHGYSADITASCVCGEPFQWIGCPLGLSPAHPCVSVDGTQLRAPLRPVSEDPGFGLGLPGFSVRYTPGPVDPDDAPDCTCRSRCDHRGSCDCEEATCPVHNPTR